MMRAFHNVRADFRHFFALARRPEDRDPPTWVLRPAEGLRRLVRALRLIVEHQSLQALLVYRLGRWVRGAVSAPCRWLPALLLAPLYVLLAALVRAAYDIRLETTADIGPGLYIGHVGGIRVARCRVGALCSIHQRVHIEPAAQDAAGPVIGDHVWIGPHATVTGPVQIGDGATIGGGALVTGHIPPGALALGRPARVVARSYDNTNLM